MDYKKLVNDWEKLIDQYDRDANQIQKQMTEMLKSEWNTTKTSLITPEKMMNIIDRTGKLILSSYSNLFIY